MENYVKTIMDVYIDSREQDLIQCFQERGWNFTSKMLDIGDIHISSKMIIERKTFHDVLASIHDGRWREQKLRTMSCLEQGCSFLYLIEVGEILWNQLDDFETIPTPKFSTVEASSGITAIFHLMTQYNIPFLFSKNIKMSANIIYTFSKNFLTVKTENTENIYQEAFIKGLHVQKKNNMDETMYYLYCLTGVPGISYKTALQISKVFPSFQEFITYLSIHTKEEFHKHWKEQGHRKLSDKSISFFKNFLTLH